MKIALDMSLTGLPTRQRVAAPAWVLSSDATAAVMDIDFLNNRAWLSPNALAISSILACSRASQKWVRTSAGLLTNFANNALPYTDLGLLPEAAATNICLHCQAINTTNWLSCFNIAVTNNAIAAPDGTVTADLLTDTNTGTDSPVFAGRLVTLPGAGTYTMSVFAKAGTVSMLRLTSVAYDAGGSGDTYFNLGTGAVGTVSAAHSNARITAHADGWYRCSVSFASTADLDGLFRIGLATLDNSTAIPSNGTRTLYLWQAQLEAGTRASSIIPTTTVAVTRAADVVSFSDVTWLSGVADSIYAKWVARNTANAAVWALDATADKILSEQSGMSPRIAGATTGNTVAADGTAKVAARLKLNDFAVALNNGTIATDTSETASGALTASRLGCDLAGANHLGSFIHRVASFNSGLSDAAIVALSNT